jgi:outer membrane lipoprotein-sorting protein
VALQTASKAELIGEYNRQAAAVTSLNAGVTMTLTAGSQYTGVIKQYHQITGFILAEWPSSIRVIGQAPVVGTNIFDMVSDGETFEIFIPSQNKFITGSENVERPSAKPIENLRPQHLINAVFLNPIPADAPVLFEQEEEGTSQFYVLTVVRAANAASPQDWEIASRVWFDRADLSIARIEAYDPGGTLASDVRYSEWDNLGGIRYPRQISLERPENDYRLDIGITKMTLNETITADRFVLKQPPGTQLERVGESAPEPESKP